MTNFTWIIGSGDWATKTKWSPNGLPTASDSAAITATGSAYTVTIDSADVASSLTQSSANATLNDTGSLTLGAGFALSAGGFNLNSGGTLTVGGTFAISGTGSFTLNSGGTLAAATTTVAGSGTFNWNGGTISGGVIDTAALTLASGVTGTFANGAQVKNAAGTGSGTINDTGVQSSLYFNDNQTFANATINLGSTTGHDSFLDDIDTAGANTVLTLASTVTVNVVGVAIMGGNRATDSMVNQGTIHQSGANGNLAIQADSFTNSGTISVSGADDKLYVRPTAFSNSGTIALSGSDDALYITPVGSAWSNSGTIAVSNGAALYLGGVVGTLGTVTNSGGAIYLEGTLKNAGNVLNGSGGAGAILLEGGAVNGGTVTAAGLMFSTDRGVLDDVIYEGTLDLTATTGLAVDLANGTQVENSAGNGPGTINDTGQQSSLYFDNTQTFANATIDLGNTAGFSSSLNESTTTQAGGVLTLASSVTINAAGDALIITGYAAGDGVVNQGTIQSSGFLSIYGQSFTNRGTLNASGTNESLYIETTSFSNSGTISVSGTDETLDITPGGLAWSNTGSMTVSAGAALYLGGEFTLTNLGSVTDSGGAIYLQGTLENTGSTLNGAGGLGQIVLDGGTINSGIVTTAGLGFSNSGGTLDDVIYEGALVLSGSGSTVDLANGAQVENITGTGPGTISNTGKQSNLFFDNTQTFANATIGLGNTAGYTSYLYGRDNLGSGTVLTLASSVTVNVVGGAAIVSGGYANDGIVNQGTISETGANSNLSISGAAFTNNGALSDGAGDTLDLYPTNFTNLAGSTLTGGAYSVGAGATLNLNSNTTITTDNADIILSGAKSVIQDDNTATNSQVQFDATLRTIGATGQLHILGGRNLSTAAAAIADNGLLELGGGSLIVSGTGSSLTIGSTGKLFGYGTASATASFASSGLIEASGGTLTLQEAVTGTGGYQIDAGADLVLDGAAASGAIANFSGAGATLTLESPSTSFTGSSGGIGGFGYDDRIDLVGVSGASAAVNASNQLIVYSGADFTGSTVATLQLTSAYSGFAFVTTSISGGTAVIALPIPPTVAQYLGQRSAYDLIPGGFTIDDTAANIAANIGQLNDADINGIAATGGTVTVFVSTFVADQSALDKIAGGFAIADTAQNIASNLDDLSDANITSITVSDSLPVAVDVNQLTADDVAIGKLTDANGSPFPLAVSDSASDIEGGLATLENDVGQIASIAVTTGTVTVNATSFVSDQTVLDKIGGGFAIADAANAITGDLDDLLDANIQSITISDNGAVGASIAQLMNDAAAINKLANANGGAYQLAIAGAGFYVSGDLDGLQADLAHIASITISDNTTVNASVGQLTSDAGAIGELSNANASPYQLAIIDSFGDVESGLSALVGDVAHIASIMATGGQVSETAAIFTSDQTTLDRIVGGYEIADSAPNIVAALTMLNADAHVVTVGVTSGAARLGGGAVVDAASLIETGSTTTLTIAENLSYGGTFTQGAGTVSVSSGDTFTLQGTSSLGGTVAGPGALALTGGSTTIASGAKLTTAKLSLTGAGASATLNENLSFLNTFTDGAGATFNVAAGFGLNLSGASTIAGTVAGMGGLTFTGGSATIGAGALISVPKWTISGASTVVNFSDNSVFAGTLTIGAGSTLNVSANDKLSLDGVANVTGAFGGLGTLALTGGTTTLQSGSTVSTANWLLSGTALATLAGNLSYSGALTVGATSTLTIKSGATLTSPNGATLNGIITGAGALAITGGASSITGARVSLADWSIANATATIGKAVSDSGAFAGGPGATLTMSGVGAMLTLLGGVDLAGATINGAGKLITKGTGAAEVGGLTIGGAVAWTNTRAITQAGGALTLGDSSNKAIAFTNGVGGVYDFTDDDGIAAGTTAAVTIANAGQLEKTGGGGVSQVAQAVANTGSITATSGTLDLEGAITGKGNMYVGAGATLQVDGGVGTAQTLNFEPSGGQFSLNDLDVGGKQLFHGAISGWAADDKLDIGTAFGANPTLAFHENTGATSGVLTIGTGSPSATINFIGEFAPGNFTPTVNASGQTVIVYQA